ncbi:unnamed protein product [Symbiodinium necroappetens]|uniref:Uncharacterized protein n=1 Tax=Symbiodinium necroappetens TaxID=1628268 RepID=A0A812VYW2_9DINO|nr:unnamed protein product [Symbiodinium necroappetens]
MDSFILLFVFVLAIVRRRRRKRKAGVRKDCVAHAHTSKKKARYRVDPALGFRGSSNVQDYVAEEGHCMEERSPKRYARWRRPRYGSRPVGPAPRTSVPDRFERQDVTVPNAIPDWFGQAHVASSSRTVRDARFMGHVRQRGLANPFPQGVSAPHLGYGYRPVVVHRRYNMQLVTTRARFYRSRKEMNKAKHAETGNTATSREDIFAGLRQSDPLIMDVDEGSVEAKDAVQSPPLTEEDLGDAEPVPAELESALTTCDQNRDVLDRLQWLLRSVPELPPPDLEADIVSPAEVPSNCDAEDAAVVGMTPPSRVATNSPTEAPTDLRMVLAEKAEVGVRV